MPPTHGVLLYTALQWKSAHVPSLLLSYPEDKFITDMQLYNAVVTKLPPALESIIELTI